MEPYPRSYQQEKGGDEIPHNPTSCSLQRHALFCLFSFGKQVVRGKAVVILLPLWRWSSMFLTFSYGKVKLAFSQSLQYNIGYRIWSKRVLAGSGGVLKAQVILSLRDAIPRSPKYPLMKIAHSGTQSRGKCHRKS